MSFPSTCDITIDLPNKEYAQICKQTLEVDPELNPDRVDRIFDVNNSQLVVHFKAIDEKNLRLGVSTFFDMVQVVLRGLSEFGDF